MADPTIINGSLAVGGHVVPGTFTLPKGNITNGNLVAGVDISRGLILAEIYVPYPIHASAWRVHDDMDSPLPSAPATDDLGINGGTHGTDAPELFSWDTKAAGAQSLYARALVPVEPEVDNPVWLRVRAAMDATADTSATIDAEVYEPDGDGAVGADLVTTAAQSINSTTYTNYDFAMAGGGGPLLDVRLTVALNDGAGASPVIARIPEVMFLAEVNC